VGITGTFDKLRFRLIPLKLDFLKSLDDVSVNARNGAGDGEQHSQYRDLAKRLIPPP
jgi:hypothetical protein